MLLHARVGGFRASTAAATAPVVRAASTGETTDDGSSITLTHPVGLANLDLMYALIASHRTSGSPHTASGWIALGNNNDSAHSATLLRKIASSGDVSAGSTVFSLVGGGTNAHFWGGILAWQAGTFNATTPEDATTTADTGSGTSAIAPTITTATNNARVLYFVTTDFRLITATPGSTTLGFNIKHSETLGGHATVYYKTQATAGAAGSATYTLNSTGEWGAWAVAVRPA